MNAIPCVLIWLKLVSAEWTQLPDAGWSPRSAFQMALSGENVIVAGGTNDPSNYYNDAYRMSLTNGLWYPLPFSSKQWPPRANFGMSTLSNGSVVLTGGQQQDGGHASLKDVWMLVDAGGQWHQLPDAPWPHRMGHTQATCKGSAGTEERVIVTGGVSNNAGFFRTTYHDVWSMAPDGTWTQLPDAPWTKRFLHGSACLSDGSLVMTGGAGGFKDFNDVWLMSSDGTWKELTSAAPFSTRARFGMVAFADDSVLVGEGMSKEDFWLGNIKENTWKSLGKPPFSERYDYGMVVLPSNKSTSARTALVAGGMLLEEGIHNYNNVYRLAVDATDDSAVWTPVQV